MYYEANSKLSFKEEKFLDITKPIYYMTDTFQSKALYYTKPPPNDFLKFSVDGVDLEPVVVYGFSLLINL
jgi:hypothetical protein